MKSSGQISEKRFLGSISTSSIRNLLPRSISTKYKPNLDLKDRKSNDENTPALDHNIQIHASQVTNSFSKESHHRLAKMDGQCETQPPLDPPVKEHIAVSNGQSEGLASSDSSVKVVVRIRPVNDHEEGGETTVKRVSSDSLSVGDRKFCFDSVLDSTSNQEDIFQLVGAPLVKDALAGYNTTILSYGQSGSGKTYTMWGPPSAMVEDPSPISNQGIVPRLFQMLFSEIQKEQENAEGKQINYQCRCSFLEIYNEQIGDLLDPTQRNLEIKDDQKNGLYVENLSEEYVTSYEDVIQILIKGLSSRKVGATSINSKSSRSHIVFTCIIESWCKETLSKCFSSSKTSRISLVDLAGSDTKKLDDAGRQHVREGEHVKKSLSQLGHLVNSLGKGIHSGNEDVLYRRSCLTHLLRESLGGNAKLTVLCSIFPDKKNNSETLSTIRFGQRVKSIRNEPVINEITEDDVNDLSDQIRLLKEELIRAKTDVNSSVVSNSGYFKGRNVRDSLNLLRISLNRSLILPRIDNDSDEEINVDVEDVKEICKQLDKLHDPCEENSRDTSDNRDSIQFSSVKESFETEMLSEDDVQYTDDIEIEDMNLEKLQIELPRKEDGVPLLDINSPNTSRIINPAFRGSISISSRLECSILPDPTLSESPKIGDTQKRSTVMSRSFLACNMSESSNLKSDVLQQSLNQSEHIRSSLQSSKILPGPTESLAASLQRGLQIIDHHQRNSGTNRASVAFSFEHLTLKPCPEVDKERPLDAPPASIFCPSCQHRKHDDESEVEDSLKTWIVGAEDAGNPGQRDMRNELEEAIKRWKELEIVCKEQAEKIEQLNSLVEQCKHGSEEHNTMEEGGDKEIIKGKCEIKNVQEELDHEYSSNASFDSKEKETLLNEIQSLRSKLQLYSDASPKKSTENLRSSLLSRSISLRRSGLGLQANTAEELEQERQRWTEMESDWISLTDELRIDIESIRQRAEKAEMQLREEKKCTEELDDALHRSVLGHGRIIEHYAELQEKYNDLAGRYRAIMEGIAEVKRAATKAGKKGNGSRFAKSLAAELSALRVEREREKEFLKKENKSLKIQLRDTAEAVHAAGELLVRLREAEQAASVSEENFTRVQEDNERLSKQLEKLKRKHKMEMVTMKQYLSDSRLPESALQPLYRDDSDIAHSSTVPFADDDQAWRAEFGASYHQHY